MLFRLVGGPQAVEKYIHALGITHMAIVATEAEMHKDGNVQYRNWSSPAAMVQLLAEFYRKKLLSTTSQEYLWQTMVDCTTGPKKIKGLLPAAAVVAHKTGSSGTDERGLTAASNDVGIMTLPDSTHVAIAVFVTDAAADESQCEAVIARIAQAVWDAHTPR
jgi:beta-lactamase class A